MLSDANLILLSSDNIVNNSYIQNPVIIHTDGIRVLISSRFAKMDDQSTIYLIINIIYFLKYRLTKNCANLMSYVINIE